jgi:hypothetical protein
VFVSLFKNREKLITRSNLQTANQSREKNSLPFHQFTVSYALIINNACSSEYIALNGSVMKKALDLMEMMESPISS